LNNKNKEIKVFAHHNEDKQLWLWTDASEGAIGGMISQDKPKRTNSTDDLTNRSKKLGGKLSRSDFSRKC
jgi:hypothetical protein